MPLVALPDELREMEGQVLADETPHPPNDREEHVLDLARSSVPDDTQKRRYRKQRSRHTRLEETLFPEHELGNDTATLLVVPNTPQPVQRRTTPNKIENYSHQSTDQRLIPVKAIKSSLPNFTPKCTTFNFVRPKWAIDFVLKFYEIESIFAIDIIIE